MGRGEANSNVESPAARSVVVEVAGDVAATPAEVKRAMDEQWREHHSAAEGSLEWDGEWAARVRRVGSEGNFAYEGTYELSERPDGTHVAADLTFSGPAANAEIAEQFQQIFAGYLANIQSRARPPKRVF